MNSKETLITRGTIIFLLLVTACGTFEVGFEDIAEQEATPSVPNPTAEVEPTEEIIEATLTPFNEDELFIRGALAERIGVQPEDVQFTIRQNTGTHILGNVSNGYFIAAKDLGAWQILYDGQGTPYCQDIEPYQVPIEMVPECLDTNDNLVFRSGDVPPPGTNLQTLDCGPGSVGASPGTVEYVACNVQDGLLSRNTSALIGLMADPFIIGYWQSEGVMNSPEKMIEDLHNLYNYYDPNYKPRLTFTADRGQFPEFEGVVLEDMFGPDVNIVLIVYSEGWGADGQGGSLLYFSENEDGSHSWYGMVIR